MTRAMLLLLVVTACSPPPRPPVPAELGPCEPPPAVPTPPARPRTVESIAAWGNAGELALRLANKRLAECEHRRAGAVRLLEQVR